MRLIHLELRLLDLNPNRLSKLNRIKVLIANVKITRDHHLDCVFHNDIQTHLVLTDDLALHHASVRWIVYPTLRLDLVHEVPGEPTFLSTLLR